MFREMTWDISRGILRHNMALGTRVFKRKLFDPTSKEPFRISRSKVDLFVECPRCFYLNLRLGVARPSMPGFTLNIAVDYLLKKEFDTYRTEKRPHPLMEDHGIKAIPFQHNDLEKWRTNFKGVERRHTETRLTLFGAVDDIWVNSNNELIVVDYKATSKKSAINLDEGWGPQYKRQLEFYQWLLRGNDLTVSDVGYFVYANGIKDRDALNNKLEFDIEVIAHEGSDAWIEDTIRALHTCLSAEAIPQTGNRCEYCPYREKAGKELLKLHKEQKVKKPKKSSAEQSTSLF